MTRKPSACLLLLLLLSPPPLTAQVSGVQQPAQKDAVATTGQAEFKKKELEKQALALLDEALTGSQALKLVENRLHIQAVAAGLLWKHDEKRARSLFHETVSTFTPLVSGMDLSDPEQQSRYSSLSQLRHEIMQTVAQHDPQLALEFVRATRLPQPHYSQGQPDQESSWELQLAMQIAAQDPKQAIQIAEQSLSKGVSYNLLNLLHQLQAKDPEAAAKLTGELIKKLRSANFTTNYEAGNVLAHLVRGIRMIRTPHSSGYSVSVETKAQALPMSDELRRELIETAAVAVQNGLPNQHELFMGLREIWPEVEKLTPTHVTALRRRLTEFEKTLDPRSRMLQEHRELLEKGTIDELLEQASKTSSDEVRTEFYRQAAWKASSKGEIERARQIINSHIADAPLRTQMLRDLERQLAWRTAEVGNVEEAQQLLARHGGSTPAHERTQLLINLASRIALKGDKKRAQQLLDQVHTQLRGPAENQQQFMTQLQLARAFAALDLVRGFEIMDAVINRFNDLLAAAAVLNGFNEQSFSDGEMRIQGGGMWSWLLRECALSLSDLARADFEQARATCDKLQRNEARTLMRLLIAQRVLLELSASQPGRRS